MKEAKDGKIHFVNDDKEEQNLRKRCNVSLTKTDKEGNRL